MKKGDSKLHGISYFLVQIGIRNFEEIIRNFVNMKKKNNLTMIVVSLIMICPLGGQPPAGLSATWGLATLRVYLAFSVTIN
jgi:hypothetical protein